MTKKRVYERLYAQVVAAIAIGALLGHFLPETGAALKPLGDGFVKLIKMLIAPIVFCTVVAGIAGMERMKQLGKTGGLALLYFEVVSTLALLLGLLVVNVLRPGDGMHVDPQRLDASGVEQYAGPRATGSASEFILDIIPGSFVGAFANNHILQVLLISVLFGIALHRIGPAARAIVELTESASRVLFGIVGLVMKLAPLGAFGAMAFTIGRYGIDSLLPLAKLVACFYLTCLAFAGIVLGTIARIHGFRIWPLLWYLREELLIVLGTSSSESVLPQLLVKLQNLGVRKSVAGLVVPTGYSFNQDGSAIYLTLAAVFLAQATDIRLDLPEQLSLLGVLLLTSKGAAGVTGSGFIVLAASLSAVGSVPVAALALILGIDRFMSEARALTNLVGNAVATIVVAKWCGALDRDVLRARLGNL